MGNQNISFRIFVSVGALLAWFALVFQFWLLIVNRKGSVPEAVVQFFSYFTILTNLMVALYFTLIQDHRRQLGWLGRASTATALTVYILIVGAVYNLILRPLWAPEGLQRLIDELLHTVNPLYFLVYWLVFVNKEALQWKHVFRWLLYPLVYCIYILARGSFTGAYPYPFIDAAQLGMSRVLLNCVMLSLVFLVVSLVFIGIAKALAARRVKHQRAASS